MTRMVWIKIGAGRSKLVEVPDDWKEGDDVVVTEGERACGDRTTSGVRFTDTGMTKEQFDLIFGGKGDE